MMDKSLFFFCWTYLPRLTWSNMTFSSRDSLIAFGISGQALSWIASYLSSRTQRVRIKDNLSAPVELERGVPQGSVLGPLLFTMYTSPLSDIANRHNLSNHYYADDSQLYVSFTPGNNHRQTDAISQVGRCVDDVKSWMITNSLKLNDSKTELMVFGTPHNLQLSPDIQLRVGDCVISPSEVVRDLVCFLDPTMSMISHVNNL